ncbi:DUF2199 domain-containing protein [Hydrogenophaga sp. BPS33]|uniref:DUF2199 domain-containing protein n=1 Tax=Hydrogenophaga sp. BPS33 TaxID=2651974 RepID=UPI0013575557|nr:DUF2199 domain-containing protein [Hydrogenophaga sp. BPS33]
MNTQAIPHDIVCDFPEELAAYFKEHDELPADVIYEPGFACSWRDERFFIHTRATLPLTDLGKGVGFGLWVEVNQYDFYRYFEATDDNDLYRGFRVEGVLANHWPGFEGACGLSVVVRAVNVEHKLHIREVLGQFEDMDPALFMSLHMQLESVGELRKYLNSALGCDLKAPGA